MDQVHEPLSDPNPTMDTRHTQPSRDFCHKAQVIQRGCDMILLSHKPLQGGGPETWTQGVSRSLWQPLQQDIKTDQPMTV